MKLRRTDLHTLAGPYALNALSPRDRLRFERHLADCDACREESQGLLEASARLAAVTAATPPAELRSRVLAAAATTRQLPPAAEPGTAGGQQPAHRARRAAMSPMLVPRLAVAVGGGFILLALALGSVMITTQHRLHLEQARSRQIAVIMNAPDRTMMTAAAAHGGSATVMMSHHDRALVLTTARLPALPHEMGYQVWLMGPAGARDEGMLPAPHHGMTAPVIVTGLDARDRVELTVGPESGSHRPASHPVVVLNLS